MIYWVHPRYLIILARIRSHSLKEEYLNYKHHNVQVFITKSFFTSTFLSMEYWKLCQDWWWLWWWRFLAMWETTQKASRNCAQFELCGKDLPSLASFWKQRCCWAGFAGRRPSPRPEAAPAWLINVFVNNYTRSLQREKVNAQFPLSYISDISHQDWCSSGWWMKSIRAGAFFQN